jgi:hypothetical protein
MAACVALHVALVEAEALTNHDRQRVTVYVEGAGMTDAMELAFVVARRERTWPTMTRFEVWR